MLFVYGRLQERRAERLRLRPAAEVARRPRDLAEWAFVLANLVVIAVLLWLPLAVMVERSLAGPGGYGLGSYQAIFGQPRGGTLFVPPVEAIANSLLFGVLATAIALAVGLLASSVVAYRRDRVGRAFDGLLMLPLGVSAVTIGFGFLVALDEPPLDLRTSIILIPLAHALVAIPFVVRSVAPVMRSIDRRLREAAALLGASPARAWREIDLPIVSRAALVGAGFAFAVSLGEFGATAFIVRPDAPTLPVAIYRLLGQPGDLNFGMAMAMSVILLVVTALAILFIERVRVGELGEF
jgi:thiamine transport system permease protein